MVVGAVVAVVGVAVILSWSVWVRFQWQFGVVVAVILLQSVWISFCWGCCHKLFLFRFWCFFGVFFAVV